MEASATEPLGYFLSLMLVNILVMVLNEDVVGLLIKYASDMV